LTFLQKAVILRKIFLCTAVKEVASKMNSIKTYSRSPASQHVAARMGLGARTTKNKLKLQKTSFPAIFASAVGGSTIGSMFGLPGVLVGAAIGSGIGFYVEKKAHA
jgi:hypothetical protein